MAKIDSEKISRLEPFKALTTAEMDLLLSMGNTEEFQEGEVIFEEGDVGDEFYLIVYGSVRITRKIKTKDQGYEQRDLGLRIWGDIFGEMSILDEQPRSASACAQSTTLLVSFPRSRLQDLMIQFPNFFTSMLKLLSLRVREALASLDH
ncbi:Crp/Fnr family transcriptional regulator [candidate division CSSED10-310 bacterium]|uniref:Crp/Fnr family transcriptional regulator n=1 Tax=candidate division CSSED10-310 bacterium TaxID=2855610 RepID=A0ABV6YXY1_UNCC1